MSFGCMLRKLLLDRGITQKQLAIDMNIPSSTLGNYIQDSREPDFKTLKQLADYFDVSLDYLCGRTDKPQGKLYSYEPQALKVKEENKADMEQFINMCFDPTSPVSAKMKEAMMNLLTDRNKDKEDK